MSTADLRSCYECCASKPAAGAAHKEVRCFPERRLVALRLCAALAMPFLFYTWFELCMAVTMHVFALQTNSKNGDLLHPLCLTSLDPLSEFW